MSLYLYKSVILPATYPLIVTIHSTPDGKSRLFGWFPDFDTEISFCRTLFDHLSVDALIFGSHYYKQQYLHCTPEMLQAKEIYVNEYFSDLPGLSLEGYYKKYSNNIMEKEIRILFPSRIMKRKGVEEALQLLALLPDNYVMDMPAFPHIENAEYTNKIKSSIQMLGLEGRALYPSELVFVSGMDHYYRKADIVFIPSHYEGFGIVAVEAMSYCVPVLTTCAGGLAEIIEDGTNGIKIDLDCPESTVHQIRKVLFDTNYRDRIVENAKHTAETKFTKKKHMDMIEKIYTEILEHYA